jgi:hypothetical protein
MRTTNTFRETSKKMILPYPIQLPYYMNSNTYTYHTTTKSASAFADKLCSYLNNPTSSDIDIRHFRQQCSGITCAGKQCRRRIRVDVAYDSAEEIPPSVSCYCHGRTEPSPATLHIMIQEIMCRSTNMITHRCIGVGTYIPIPNDTDTTAYQLLNYVDSAPTPQSRLMERPTCDIGCDREVWIDPRTRVRIYYVREAGRVLRTQVSGRSQLEANIQACEIAVEQGMVGAGSGDCGICYETKPLWNLGCDHMFCRDCIARFACRNVTCPMCRRSISCLSELSERQETLMRYQIESPDYVIHRTELFPECVDAHAPAFRIRIKSTRFLYADLLFTMGQEMEYRMIVMLLEHKLVFRGSSYDDAVYLRNPCLSGNPLMERLRDHDMTLIQELGRYAMECGLDEIDLLLCREM